MSRTHLMFGFLLTWVCLGGCASSPWTLGNSQQGWLKPSFSKPNAATAQPANANLPNPSATASNAQSNAQAMQEIMEELRQLGTLDPAAQNKLMEDLRQTDPALWPLVMQQFRAAIAYKRRAAQRETMAHSGNLMNPLTASNAVGTSTVQRLPPDAGNQSADGSKQTAAIKDAASTSDVSSSGSPPGNIGAGAVQPADSPPVKRLVDERPVQENDNSVKTASYNAESDNAPADWREQLSATIRALKSSESSPTKAEDELARQARLRMLYVLAGRRDEALEPIPSAGPAMQEFWSKELYGLAMMLDAEKTPDAAGRAAEGKQFLGEALTHLGESAPLVVRNLAFCTAVQSYGCYTPFKKNEFTPGQEVLLYAEMDNFATESTPKGFHTVLRSSYQIFDAGGQRVADHTFTTTEEYCQNPRRDFFIGFHLRMPQRINPGKYNLQLTIEDVKSQKVGQSSIEFTIKQSEK